ncbi:MAG: RNA methyltransferase, partial [Bacteroidetes bacterium]
IMYIADQKVQWPMALSRSSIKSIKALHLKKFRQKYNNFIVEGDKIVSELLQQERYQVQALYALPEWLAEKGAGFTNFKGEPHAVSEKELAQISQLRTPNQVLAVVRIPPAEAFVAPHDDWVIYLDALQDPGNVGTILRIADWFAIRTVIAGPGTVELYNSKVLQATMGAFLRVRWVEADLAQLLNPDHPLPVWAATMQGQDIFSLPKPEGGILCIGNEGQGLSPATLALAKQQVSVPAPAGSGAESLNAAVATGILCAALRRG